MWKAINLANRSGCAKFDLGRVQSEDNELATYKRHWGTQNLPIAYLRIPEK